MKIKGFYTKKSLGQNFIFDRNILSNIKDAAGLKKDDYVIEIGAGFGTLTRELAKTAKKIVAFEIDKDALEKLHDNLKEFKNVVILNEDIMKSDLKSISNKYFNNSNCKVVANIPYYITSPIIMMLLESHIITEITILIQKEVADRICAKTGTKDYGVLTIAVNYYSKPERLFDLPPEVFYPKPKVVSTLVKLYVYEKPLVYVKDIDLFFKLVKASFSQRRKIISNSLKTVNIEKTTIDIALKKCNIDKKVRGETLSIEKFAELSNTISDFNNK